MEQQTLKERMLSLRNRTEISLSREKYIMIMLDGRSFSNLIKNRFEKPFDDNFIRYMDETAKYLCKNISGCKMAYTQSDEITLIVTCFENQKSEPFFDYRINKILSISASMASAKFNRLWMEDIIKTPCSQNDMIDMINHIPLISFDCKVWEMDNYFDAVSWIIFRQNDCIKNSVSQTAQTLFSQKELEKVNTEERIKKMIDEKGVNWNDFDDSVKYGRFIYKVEKDVYVKHINGTVKRNEWEAFPAFKITENKDRFHNMNLIPKME